jgi:hypothetical protein
MHRTFAALVLLAISISLFAGCFTMNHVVGDGSQSGSAKLERQWYVLWGLVPINNVDTKAMADGATNYTIKTEYTPLDFVINIFTSIVSVNSMTVEVKK